DVSGNTGDAAADALPNAAAGAVPGSPDTHTHTARPSGAHGKKASAENAPVNTNGTTAQSGITITGAPGKRDAKGRTQKDEQKDKNDATDGVAPAPPAIVTDFTQAPKAVTASWAIPGSALTDDAAATGSETSSASAPDRSASAAVTASNANATIGPR